MRGKLWPVEDERKLRDLVSIGASVSDISREFCGRYSVVSVRLKMSRLGLVDRSGFFCASSSSPSSSTSQCSVPSSVATSSNVAPVPVVGVNVDLKLPEVLPSLEEKLKVLCAASTALEQPNLSKNSVFRLRALVDSLRSYQVMFGGYVKVSELEREVVELRKKLAFEMSKSQESVSQNVAP